MGSARQPYRGLLILIPHERRAQSLAPEDADGMRASAGERPRPAFPGDEGVGGFKNTELVALGISKDEMGVIRTLANVDFSGAQLDETFYGRSLVIQGLAAQIEMDLIWKPLVLRACNKVERKVGSVLRIQRDDYGIPFISDFPLQRAGPETCQAFWVVSVPNQTGEF